MDKWFFTHKYKAKIIDNELFLTRTHHVRGPSHGMRQFRLLTQRVDLPVCRHLSFGFEDRVTEGIARRDLLAATPSTDQDEQWASWRDVQGSCENCLTDYEFRIQEYDNNGKLSIKLTTYHLVGTCRTPRDPEWLAFGAAQKEDSSRNLDCEHRGRLQIRKRWKGGDN